MYPTKKIFTNLASSFFLSSFNTKVVKCIWTLQNTPLRAFDVLIIDVDYFPFKSCTPSFIENMYNCFYFLCPNIEIKLLRMQHIANTFYNDLFVLLYYFMILLKITTWSVCFIFNPCFSQKLFECITYVLPIVVIFEFHHGISCWLHFFCLHFLYKKTFSLLFWCNKKI